MLEHAIPQHCTPPQRPLGTDHQLALQLVAAPKAWLPPALHLSVAHPIALPQDPEALYLPVHHLQKDKLPALASPAALHSFASFSALSQPISLPN